MAERTPEQRFFAKVRGDDETGCWNWIGCRSTDHHGTPTYGQLHLGAGMERAHRLAYEWFVGPIPDGLELDHLCKNKGCVNPKHLEAVTRSENILRGTQAEKRRAVAARITHCPQGHAYDEINTFYDAGKRKCRQCSRARQRRYSTRLRQLRDTS